MRMVWTLRRFLGCGHCGGKKCQYGGFLPHQKFDMKPHAHVSSPFSIHYIVDNYTYIYTKYLNEMKFKKLHR